MKLNPVKLGLAASAFLLSAVSAQAATCVGACGSSSVADGVVSLAPGNTGYQWISTSGGVNDGGVITSVGDVSGGGVGGAAAGATGSSYITNTFAALAGDILSFNFNYVTADGSTYTDYAWAELQTSAGDHVAWLFTGRTASSGNTSPGQGLPLNESMLSPSSSAIISDGTFQNGGPVWTALGGSSNTCFDAGCGHTGWINSSYAVANAGTYQLVLGVQNWDDGEFDSGLAFAGAKIGGIDIDPGTPGTPNGDVPLPAAALLLMSGIAGLGGMSRFRKSK